MVTIAKEAPCGMRRRDPGRCTRVPLSGCVLGEHGVQGGGQKVEPFKTQPHNHAPPINPHNEHNSPRALQVYPRESNDPPRLCLPTPRRPFTDAHPPRYIPPLPCLLIAGANPRLGQTSREGRQRKRLEHLDRKQEEGDRRASHDLRRSCRGRGRVRARERICDQVHRRRPRYLQGATRDSALYPSDGRSATGRLDKRADRKYARSLGQHASHFPDVLVLSVGRRSLFAG